MTFFARLRAYFFAGVLATAPIGITLYLTWLIIDFIDGQVTPLIPERYNPESYLPFTVPDLGVVVAAVVLTLIGALNAGLLGRWMVRVSDRIIQRMQGVRELPSAVTRLL